MNKFQLKYQRFGDHTLLIHWPEEISEAILEDILRYKTSLRSHYEIAVDCWHAYHSLAIQFKDTIQDVEREIQSLKEIYKQTATTPSVKNQHWNIPVCYEGEFAPDIKLVSRKNNLTENEVVKIHTHPNYKVYFNGFLPGFPYLGGLDKRLFTQRKASPALQVPKGAVGIGGMQTGVYPQESPGGWHIIGQTPIAIFKVQELPPVLLKPGDSLQFYAITTEEFFQIKEAVNAQKFNYKSMRYHG